MAEKLLHFIPSYRRSIRVEVAQTMAMEAKWCTRNGIDYVPLWADFHGVDRARNRAVEIAEHYDADYLFMQDNDCWYQQPDRERPGLAIASLLVAMEEHDCAAAGLVYALRGAPVVNVAPTIPGSSYRAEKLGAGTLLLDMRKLAKVPRPLFRFVASDDGLKSVGEDIYFCRLLHQHGLSIAADYSMVTFHAGEETLPLDPREANARFLNGGETTARVPEAKTE